MCHRNVEDVERQATTSLVLEVKAATGRNFCQVAGFYKLGWNHQQWWYSWWLHPRSYLVGGLEHGFYDLPDIGKNNLNWRTHSFQRGWNHQPEDNIDNKLGCNQRIMLVFHPINYNHQHLILWDVIKHNGILHKWDVYKLSNCDL
jgi:hypothetical protein